MDKKNIIKKVIALIGSACTASVIDNVIKSYVPIRNGKARIATMIGAAVLSGMVGAKASDYIEGEIDDICDAFTSMKECVEVEKVEIEQMEN